MDPGTLLLLALLLVCPLAMIFMMRGGHGHHGGDQPLSLDQLRARRSELDAEIEARERGESRPARPVPR